MSDGSAGQQARERASKVGPLLLLGAAVTAWLWPIGLDNKMPVGGDTTQFSMGLMAFLKESLAAGRLPLWNDLWGYGFPGLAESQMGVFYPPHLMLYGAPMTVEFAYTFCLMLHVYWGAFGGYFAGRCFGVGRWSAALTGYAFATCGFFFIHIPHQWAYTTGSWMPWAWGLAWLAIRGEGSRQAAVWLAAVLAIQLLPGHFQLAFNTQVGVGLIALAGTSWDRPGVRRLLSVGLAGLAMIPLALLQLLPTYELASLAEADRDFEYLSGFASTPFHLVGYVAPGLFHRSPLWRPLIWDTFHTSPEENLAYVGIVALFLAVIGLRKNAPDDRVRRVLAVLVVATLLLSFGPYVPGFRWLIRLPGFSFFRAPARWSLSTALALAVLAGRGLGMLPTLKRPGRWLGGFSLASAAWLLAVIGLIELGFAATASPQRSAIDSIYQAAMDRMPWMGDPSFRQRMAEARQVQNDVRVLSGQARLGYPLQTSWKLSDERANVYRIECWDALAVLAALLILAPFLAWKPRVILIPLCLIALAEPLILKSYRPYDLGPNLPLIEQSRILSTYTKHLKRGVRVVDRGRNLAMVAGRAPISSYRTLDLPAARAITRIAEGPVLGNPESIQAMQVAGVQRRIVDPYEVAKFPRSWVGVETPGISFDLTIRDPVLAGWIDGEALIRSSPGSASDYGWATINGAGLQVRISSPDRPPVEPDIGLTEIYRWFFGPGVTKVWDVDRPRPESLTFQLPSHGADSPTSKWVILTQLYHPNWKAEWIDPTTGAAIEPATLQRVLDGWTGIDVTGRKAAGSIRLTYSEPKLPAAMAISGLSWLVWLGTFFKLGPRPRDEPRGVELGGGASE